MNIDLKEFTESLLKDNSIEINPKSNKKQIIKDISKFLDVLIFNIVSVGCIIALLNNSKKIKEDTLNIIKKYIYDKCTNHPSKMSGGGDLSMPSEFYGYDSGRYNEQNTGGDLLVVDWSKGIARPAIGYNEPQLKGGGSEKPKKPNAIKTYIKIILNYYKISASDIIIKKLLNIYKYHIDCLIKNLKDYKKPITSKYVSTLLDKNKILKSLK
jgi:hypothetical protein